MFFGILLAVTWPLWLGQSEFPSIPLVSLPLPIGSWHVLGILATLMMAIGLVLQWASARYQPWGLKLILAGLVLSFLVDQHRLQAWADQFFFIAVFLNAISPAERENRGKLESGAGTSEQILLLLRWLTCGIYIYSSFSKIDASFLASVGPEMVNTLIGSLGMSLEQFSTRVQNLLVLSLPVTEGLIGLALISGWFRRTVVVLAVVMHLALILVVGPWGWQHQWGVFVWNLFFVFQVVCLFWPSADRSKVRTRSFVQRTPLALSHSRPVAVLALGFALVFPLSEPFGVCDHWLAWELYAPRTSRAKVYLASYSRDQLPEAIQDYLQPSDRPGWELLDLAEWSLTSRRAPLYPEDRFQLGLAMSLRRWIKDDRAVGVIWRKAANRWTGEREEQWISGFSGLERIKSEFRLNLAPLDSMPTVK